MHVCVCVCAGADILEVYDEDDEDQDEAASEASIFSSGAPPRALATLATSMPPSRGDAHGLGTGRATISRGSDRLPTPILKRTGTLRDALIEESDDAHVEFRAAEQTKNVAFR